MSKVTEAENTKPATNEEFCDFFNQVKGIKHDIFGDEQGFKVHPDHYVIMSGYDMIQPGTYPLRAYGQHYTEIGKILGGGLSIDKLIISTLPERQNWETLKTTLQEYVSKAIAVYEQDPTGYRQKISSQVIQDQRRNNPSPPPFDLESTEAKEVSTNPQKQVPPK